MSRTHAIARPILRSQTGLASAPRHSAPRRHAAAGRGFVRSALLAAAAIALSAAGPEDGWHAYSAGRFTEAVAIWTQAAAAGDAQAQFGLGIAYDLGQGVGQDEARACTWYRRAGEAGIAAASFDMAVMLDQGRCGARDAAQAAEWYGRAAADGHARAEYDLAQMYEAGDGVPRNLDQALTWYQAASADGIAAAGTRAAALASRPRSVRDDALQPVLPTTPVDARLPDRGAPTPFVWTAPAGPEPVRFFLEVYELRDTGAREVAARFADRSAVLVQLQPGAAHYAWRVSSVAPDGHHYVLTAWRRFDVAGRSAP